MVRRGVDTAPAAVGRLPGSAVRCAGGYASAFFLGWALTLCLPCVHAAERAGGRFPYKPTAPCAEIACCPSAFFGEAESSGGGGSEVVRVLYGQITVTAEPRIASEHIRRDIPAVLPANDGDEFRNSDARFRCILRHIV